MPVPYCLRYDLRLTFDDPRFRQSATQPSLEYYADTKLSGEACLAFRLEALISPCLAITTARKASDDANLVANAENARLVLGNLGLVGNG